MLEWMWWIPPLGHGFAAAYSFSRLGRDSKPVAGWGGWVVPAATALHGLVLLFFGWLHGRIPFASMGEALSVSCLVLALAYLAVERLARTESLGVFFLVPVTLGTAVSASLPQVERWPLHLRSPLFAIHASLGATALAFLFSSSLLAGAYLTQYRLLEQRRLGGLAAKLPDLSTLGRFFHLCGSLGTAMLVASVGAGALWIHRWGLSLEGAFWKTVAVGVAISWFAGVDLLRLRKAFTARTSARLAMIGAIVVVLVLLAGTHG